MATIPTAYTWTVGEQVTAAKMNAYVRDLATFLLNIPAVRLWHNTTQSVVDSTDAALAFNQEALDSDNGHSTVTNNSRYTVQTAGTWEFTAIVPWAGSAAGKRELSLRVNNTTTYGGQTVTATGSNRLAACVTVFAPMSVSDYMEAWVWQNSGGALLVDNTFRGGQWLLGKWIRI